MSLNASKLGKFILAAFSGTSNDRGIQGFRTINESQARLYLEIQKECDTHGSSDSGGDWYAND